MAIYTLWNQTPTPADGGNGDYTTGTLIHLSVAANINAIWFYHFTADTSTTYNFYIYPNTSGAALVSGTISGLSGTGWRRCPFSAPYAAAAGDYRTALYSPTFHFPEDTGILPVTNGILSTNGGANGACWYASNSYPLNVDNYCTYIDIEVETTSGNHPLATLSRCIGKTI
jgi:hypothetical protein